MIINFEKNSIMKSIADFKNHYNQLVNDWFNNTFSTNPFMAASKESWANLPCIGCMPEPYYGKIDCNSVAILNLHPAFHGNDLSNLNRTIMAPIVGGNYAKYAEAFPPLISYRYPMSTQWWQNLENHIKGVHNFQKTNKKPFAIEVCPWHAKQFGPPQKEIILSNATIYNEVYNYVIRPYLVGIVCSDFKIGIVLSNIAGDIIKTMLNIKRAKRLWNYKNSHYISWVTINNNFEKVTFAYIKVPVKHISQIFLESNIKMKQSYGYIKILCIGTPNGQLPKNDYWISNGVIDMIIKYIQAN